MKVPSGIKRPGGKKWRESVWTNSRRSKGRSQETGGRASTQEVLEKDTVEEEGPEWHHISQTSGRFLPQVQIDTV
jgi:hypothetical protein